MKLNKNSIFFKLLNENKSLTETNENDYDDELGYDDLDAGVADDAPFDEFNNDDFVDDLYNYQYTYGEPENSPRKNGDRWGAKSLIANKDPIGDSQAYADAGEWADSDSRIDTDEDFEDTIGAKDHVEYDRRKDYELGRKFRKHRRFSDTMDGSEPKEIDVPDNAKWYD